MDACQKTLPRLPCGQFNLFAGFHHITLRRMNLRVGSCWLAASCLLAGLFWIVLRREPHAGAVEPAVVPSPATVGAAPPVAAGEAASAVSPVPTSPYPGPPSEAAFAELGFPCEPGEVARRDGDRLLYVSASGSASRIQHLDSAQRVVKEQRMRDGQTLELQRAFAADGRLLRESWLRNGRLLSSADLH